MRTMIISTFLLFALCGSAQNDTIFSFVDQMPEFPGGDKAMMSFIGRNVAYPESERVNNIEGKVLLRFVVDTDGSVTNATVLKHVSPGIDSEAIRVVKMLPNFVPGKQDGKPVKVYYNLPVRFMLKHLEAPIASAKVNPDSNGVYTFVEQNPQFPGGSYALSKFIHDNLQMPKDYKDNGGLQPKVLTRLVVNEDGSVSDVRVSRSFQPAFDAEAVRVIKMLPHFVPGRQNGKLVKVYFNVPVELGAKSWVNIDSTTAKILADQERIYTFVDQNPQFPGGDVALIKFFAKNMIYPESARQKGIQGQVLLRFIVDRDGTVTNVIVVRSLDPDLDNEAVRLVSILPKFKPGYDDGRAVKVYFNLPVTFKLSNKH